MVASELDGRLVLSMAMAYSIVQGTEIGYIFD